ncbi:hypothetical protein LVB77_09035 [Lysobacter sp. 5GHs7-4]|uniref:hypothetical protein n=1 Tax=Lysobacter sp. 5GHs7-4 TaxID=2904253 RepID=UPI001E3BEEF1|nr:hypothetical protein [Lysobacter sp. 5GHs7-4]UHQ24802.1 hypothetical protein LVB77_09035 [Lysobacter sp. 5GHs7-4]
MKRQTPDPLSPEERALADRLARLGPHDGPSPALDAKILAAAHAAAASTRAPQRARRRWALSAIPGGLITGLGVAATMALAVGVVWQLRPISPSREAPIHEPADGAYTSAEMISRPRELIAPPPPPAPIAAQAAPSAAATAAAPAAPSLAAAAAKPAEDAAAQGYLDSDAPSPPPRDLRQQRNDKAALADASDAAASDAAAGVVAGNAAAARAAPAYAPPMPAAASAPAGADASDNFGLVPTRSRRAADAAEERREAEAAAQMQRSEAKQAQAAPSAAKQADTLDRVEVTGSRVKRAEVEAAQPTSEVRPAAFPLPPVREDARLERADWLDRIRARRDAGQAEEARASLALFRKSHPRVRIPDDLRALLR